MTSLAKAHAVEGIVAVASFVCREMMAAWSCLRLASNFAFLILIAYIRIMEDTTRIIERGAMLFVLEEYCIKRAHRHDA